MIRKFSRVLKKRFEPVWRNADLLAKATGESIRAQYPKERLKEQARKTALLLGVILLGPLALALLVLGAANAFGFEYWSARRIVMGTAGFFMHPPAWSSEGHWAFRTAGVLVSHAPLAVSAFLAAVAAWHLLCAIFWALIRHHFERTFTTPAFQSFVREALGKHFGPTLVGTPDRRQFLSIAPIRLRSREGPAVDWVDHAYRPWTHAEDRRSRWLLKMHRALKRPTIKYPNRIGFAATRVDAGYGQMKVQTCKYQEDQDSAYRLGFEYYLWFLLCRASRTGHRTPVLARCPVHLKALLTDIGDWKKSHCEGPLIEHHELGALLNDKIFEKHVRTQLGVQALVVFRDYQDLDAARRPRWKVVLQKRSPDVSSSPNHLQFIPSGGFESHQQLHGDSIDSFTESLLAREVDLKRALLREFAEEVLGVDEFMANENYDPAEIMREPGIRSLKRAFDNGTANLQCLGIAMSLIGFKGEVSYVLWIDHPTYFVRHRLKRSEGEARVIFTWPLAELDELVSSNEHPLVDASRTLLHMAVHDDWWNPEINKKAPRLDACDVDAIIKLRAQTPAFNDPLPPLPIQSDTDVNAATTSTSRRAHAAAL
jgi:hypothetical protein